MRSKAEGPLQSESKSHQQRHLAIKKKKKIQTHLTSGHRLALTREAPGQCACWEMLSTTQLTFLSVYSVPGTAVNVLQQYTTEKGKE